MSVPGQLLPLLNTLNASGAEFVVIEGVAALAHGQLDVLGEVREVCSYPALLSKSVKRDVDGRPCRFIDIDTLIAAKRVANRTKDLLSVQQLEILKTTRSS